VTSYIKVGIDEDTKVIAAGNNHTNLLDELRNKF
jgi:hypothetical protein